jgi:hypothetical protein
MDKKIERLITAGMIAGLVAVFLYQVAYGVESGGYPIVRYDKYDRMKITQTGFQAGKQDGYNAVADVGDTCNDGRTPAANDIECTQGYIDGYNTTCHTGVAKFGTEVVVHFPSSYVPSF